MSSGRPTVRDLAEEAKKRAALLFVFVFGLAYLMSLTSSSVWVNLPAAAAIVMFCRYISLDLDFRKRSAACVQPSSAPPVQRRSVELFKYSLECPNWRIKVNSPAVEIAITQFTKHLVTEWVTDLWYSRVTPDKEGPEELIQVMNGVMGEICCRARDINLIDLLTRDIINLISSHLELYRSVQSKIGFAAVERLSVDSQDIKLKLVLAEEKKLHPALFSAEAEHKVLQHLMDGLISLTFRPQELQCTFFRYTARELLACVVVRPIINLANPRFINEKIESIVLSRANKADKGAKPSDEQALRVKHDGSSKTAVQFSGDEDHSAVGVELVQLKNEKSKFNAVGIVSSLNGSHFGKDLDNHSHTLNNQSGPLHSDYQNHGGKKIGASKSLGESELAPNLDVVGKQKNQALTLEHVENVWTKGRDYKKKDDGHQGGRQAQKSLASRNYNSRNNPTQTNYLARARMGGVHIVNGNASPVQLDGQLFSENQHILADSNIPNYSESRDEKIKVHVKEADDEPVSDSSHFTDDDENSNITGLDSPGTKIWDSKNKRQVSDSRIRHPLEASEFQSVKNVKRHARHPRTTRTSSGKKRTRSSNDHRALIWQELERSSFPVGDSLDILNSQKQYVTVEEIANKVDVEACGRVHGGAAATSTRSVSPSSDLLDPSLRYPNISLLADSFLKLRCEVSGANIVKSGSGTFAVYSILVNDANNKSWSIKRRFRHFEELHRRLKEFLEYNLSLPPKHFLSSGLEEALIQERCKLLNKYLKNLLQLPTVSGSIEVWDFLSVDSQTYTFSNSLTIIQTLPVAHDMTPSERNAKDAYRSHTYPRGDYKNPATEENPIQTNTNWYESESFGLTKRKIGQDSRMSTHENQRNVREDNSGSESEKWVDGYKSTRIMDRPVEETNNCAMGPLESSLILETDDDSSIPTEWMSPNLSVPILDLIDVLFQLHDGKWIRRQAFWVAKQLLQLGMGDAFDDWLIDKIQLLRKGSVIASAINRLEQILWPDGIFLTKHPNRKARTPVASPKEGSQKGAVKGNLMLDEQHLEAARRAKFVRELIIDKAPSALVCLFGRKEYERCAEDVYSFVQSPVCMKQLALELLELLLLALFPELEEAVRKCHEEKEQFGVFEDYKFEKAR